jgi:hypothetical protein
LGFLGLKRNHLATMVMCRIAEFIRQTWLVLIIINCSNQNTVTFSRHNSNLISLYNWPLSGLFAYK